VLWLNFRKGNRNIKRNGWFYAYFLKRTPFSWWSRNGGQIPVGAGLAFADKYFETGGVTMTMEMHVVHYMKLQHGNAVEITSSFIVENNGYAMGTSVERTKPY
jgi:TPP-dependent pyruvate/acetoin dehydrogenase alpha subunit